MTDPGPAAAGGLKPGDVIVEFGGSAIKDVPDLQKRVAAIELAGKGVARGLSETCIRAIAGGLDCDRLCGRSRQAVSHHRIRHQRINRGVRFSTEKRGERILYRRQPVRWNLRKPEIIFLPKPAARHVVDLDVQSRCSRARPHHEIRARLGERREVDVFLTRPPNVVERRAVENERLHAIAVIEVALDDRARGVTRARIDLQHHHTRRNLEGLLRLGPAHDRRLSANLAVHRRSERQERHSSDEELAISISHQRLNLLDSGIIHRLLFVDSGPDNAKPRREIPPRLYSIGVLVVNV